ncbi:DUF192 domain-containing protein [Borrelia sp. A-FGy1]|uniref:DUF192 domain-containing protein n=1 Tax=Borrelia sp. A-FGy1 TaxID=2608247 RepID=UPI0015F5D4AC|nr:DUF192 domain-containing protein [Borrelia sp. A-FGy1]QMU99415.1 DUF192 domain-containing protein [Borrelia sp. A-FGy1]
MKDFFFFFVLIFCVSCVEHIYDKEISINNAKFFVKVAADDFSRTKGYKGTKNINEINGILFMFNKEKNLSFWMKDTPIPLEIAYIDSRGIIKEIYKLVPFSEKNVISKYKVKYALEVPEGSFAKFKINVGDIVEFNFDINSIRIE